MASPTRRRLSNEESHEPPKRTMTLESFQLLYKLIRGNKCAAKVIEAQNLAAENDFLGSLENLQEARQSYAEHYSRSLKQPELAVPGEAVSKKDEKKRKKLEKIEQAMSKFDQLILQIDRRAKRTGASQGEASSSASPSRAPGSTSNEPISGNPIEFKATESGNSRELIERVREFYKSPTTPANLELTPEQLATKFRLRKVESVEHLRVGNILYLQTQQANVLTQIKMIDPLPSTSESTTHLISVLDERPIKPVTLGGLLQLASQRTCYFLTDPDTHQSSTTGSNTNELTQGTTETTPAAESEITTGESSGEEQSTQNPSVDHQNILDLGSFSQLLTSAQRCGLVPNADQIGYVRDKEFRQGKYDKAFQSIDMMHNRFLASAGQRLARLNREDVDIAAGRIKISPRELQAKRSRDRLQTQEVDRAKRRFQVVLEGLRILMNHDLESRRDTDS